MDEAAPIPLPDLHTGLLDAAGVEALLRDYAQCTQQLEIIPKHGPQTAVPDGVVLSLAAAGELLASRSVRGMQFRYRHEGVEWWDTLMAAPEGWRLFRLQR